MTVTVDQVSAAARSADVYLDSGSIVGEVDVEDVLLGTVTVAANAESGTVALAAQHAAYDLLLLTAAGSAFESATVELATPVPVQKASTTAVLTIEMDAPTAGADLTALTVDVIPVSADFTTEDLADLTEDAGTSGVAARPLQPMTACGEVCDLRSNALLPNRNVTTS